MASRGKRHASEPETATATIVAEEQDVTSYKSRYETPVPIGVKGICVRIDVYRNNPYVNLRHYMTVPDATNVSLCPTRKGVIFNMDEWHTLCGMMKDINDDVSTILRATEFQDLSI